MGDVGDVASGFGGKKKVDSKAWWKEGGNLVKTARLAGFPS